MKNPILKIGCQQFTNLEENNWHPHCLQTTTTTTQHDFILVTVSNELI